MIAVNDMDVINAVTKYCIRGSQAPSAPRRPGWSGLRHAIEPLDAESQPVQWELP